MLPSTRVCLVLGHCWIQPPMLCIGNLLHLMHIFFSCLMSWLREQAGFDFQGPRQPSLLLYIRKGVLSLTSQLELPGVWFAREYKCGVPHWSPTSCFIAGRESKRYRTGNSCPASCTVTPGPGAFTLGHTALWVSSHVAQEYSRTLGGYTSLSGSFTDPAKFLALWNEELSNSHPFLQLPEFVPFKVSRICLPNHYFSPGHFYVAWQLYHLPLRTPQFQDLVRAVILPFMFKFREEGEGYRCSSLIALIRIFSLAFCEKSSLIFINHLLLILLLDRYWTYKCLLHSHFKDVENDRQIRQITWGPQRQKVTSTE